MKAALPTACVVVFAAWATSAQAAFRCDLAYEVVSAEQGDAALDLEAHLAVTKAEAARVEQLLEIVFDEAPVSVSPATVTWGGWRGRSNPTLHLVIDAASPREGWPAARRLARHLAWLYQQEAVLLACSAPETNSQALPLAYSVTAEPESFFNETDGLFAFFGTLMAFAQNADVGYTRRNGAFWTIDFAGDLDEPLRKTLDFFQSLSGNGLRLTLHREPVAVALVGVGEAAPDVRLWQQRRQIDGQLQALAGG